MYFIIIPSVYDVLPLFVKTTPFPKSILLSKFPPATYPPSLVSATEVIFSSLLLPISLAWIVIGFGNSVFSNFIIIPLLAPLDLKVIPFPKSILLLSKYPPAIYPPSLVPATEFIWSPLLLPPITFAHSHSPLLLYFIIIPSEPTLFVRLTPFPKSILLSKDPPARIPPSLVSATEFIWSLLLPPITFAHSHSPLLLYFIIIPSSLPLLLKFTPFPKSILLDEKDPPATYPPSVVSATEFIWSLLLPPITFAHSHSPLLLYFIIIPSSLPLLLKFTPFPKSILLDEKDPPATYPPSLVSVTEYILETLLSPIPFAHSTSPSALYFIIIPLIDLSFVLRITPFPRSILLLSKYPPAIIPPSLVSATEFI